MEKPCKALLTIMCDSTYIPSKSCKLMIQISILLYQNNKRDNYSFSRGSILGQEMENL